jgi:hypothetical protein
MAFDMRKNTIMSVPVLASLNPDWDIIVEMDPADYISPYVVSQYNDDNILHPMVDFPKTFSPVEYNYQI